MENFKNVLKLVVGSAFFIVSVIMFIRLIGAVVAGIASVVFTIVVIIGIILTFILILALIGFLISFYTEKFGR